MERRRHTRHERYFPLRFGDEGSEFDAQTRDVSAGGLFVATPELRPLGTRLWLELVVEPQRPLRFEVVVVRQKDSPTGQRREGGFGVRFLSPSEVLGRYFPPSSEKKPATASVVLASAAEVELAVHRNLGHGYCFVWSAQEQSVGDQVQLTLSLPFAGRSLETGACVTQLFAEGARFGLALALDDTVQVMGFLLDTLEGKR